MEMLLAGQSYVLPQKRYPFVLGAVDEEAGGPAACDLSGASVGSWIMDRMMRRGNEAEMVSGGEIHRWVGW